MADQPEAKRAFGRSLGDFGELSDAERRLVEACRVGQVAEFGDGTRPGPLALLIKLPAGRPPTDVLGDFPALRDAPEPYMRWRLLPRAKDAAADAARIWVRIVPLADVLMLPADLPARLAVPLRWLRTWPTSNWWGHRIAFWWPAAEIPHANLHDWLMSIRVRSGLVRFLLLGGDVQTAVHEYGVRLQGAWLAGVLDLEACSDVRPLWTFVCRFDTAPVFRDGRLAVLGLSGSFVPGFNGNRMQCRAGVFLRDGFVARGTVELLGAEIGGDLDATHGRFGTFGPWAVSMDGATVGGSVFLRGAFAARRAVRLLAAKIGRDLDCSRGRFDGSAGNALCCDGASIGGNVFLQQGFLARGSVRLTGAQIGGSVECRAGRFDVSRGSALHCDRVSIGGGLFLSEGFLSRGEVRLLGAEIGGDLACADGRFEAPGLKTLSCDGLKISGNVLLRDGFVALGSVRLVGAKIGGSLDCDRGHFQAPGYVALDCNAAIVNGNAVLRTGFVALGEVNFLGARIGGNLACGGGRFEAPGGIALACDGAEIGGGVLLRDLVGVRGRIQFSSASAATLLDDDGCWAAPNAAPGEYTLILDGFTYQRIGDGPTDAVTRLRWLKRQHTEYLTADFRPQPWEQLIKVLRDMGHPEDARRVAIEKQRMILRNDVRRLLVNAPQWRSPFFAAKLLLIWLYGLFTGFGYRPLRTVGAMVGVWLVGALLFASAARQGIMVPTDVDILLHKPEAENSRPLRETCAGNWTRCAGLPPEYPAFQPLVYSLELILPVVDLQQARKWTPRVDQPGPARLRDDFPRFVRAFMWFEILFGWAGTLLLTAVLSGLAKKD
jgi:hypothetical protein